MDDRTLQYSIGDLARRTGLTVKTIRFYADEGRPPRGRYRQLLSVINGWPVPESLASVFEWFTRALRAHGVREF
ncbi:MerR family transcriptional regulator [Kitasatospora sp. NBC_00085]